MDWDCSFTTRLTLVLKQAGLRHSEQFTAFRRQVYTVAVPVAVDPRMNLFQVVLVLTSLALVLSSPAYADPRKPGVDWKTLYSRNGILVEKGQVAGSSNLAFRGTGLVQADIGRVISVLYVPERANQWVYELSESRALRDTGLSAVVWQRFDNPFPVKDRDFVYFAEPVYDASESFFTARMIDIQDTDIVLTDEEQSLIPDQSCCVVGKLIYSEWQFRAYGPGRTCVQVEVMFDPGGSLPKLFVNRFQKKWSFETIKGLRAQATREDIDLHETFGEWAGDDRDTAREQPACN